MKRTEPTVRFLLVNAWKEEGSPSITRGTISFCILDLPSGRRVAVRTKDVMECQSSCEHSVTIRTFNSDLVHTVMCNECHGVSESFMNHRKEIEEHAKNMFPELTIIDSAEKLKEFLAQHKKDSKIGMQSREDRKVRELFVTR